MKQAGLLLAGLLAGEISVAQGFEEQFTKLDRNKWVAADYDFSHPKFDTDWRAALAQADKGLVLGLQPQQGRHNRFAGASVHRRDVTGFGRYEAVIQPARGAGIVTGFFTYTGPAYGTRHDEIDIEFLGRDTRKIHLASFVDGKIWNRFVDLGFDAAEKPRLYAFDWGPDFLRWYAEDRLICQRTASDGPIPQVPGHLFSNIWAADRSIAAWAGSTKPGVFAQSSVDYLRYTPRD